MKTLKQVIVLILLASFSLSASDFGSWMTMTYEMGFMPDEFIERPAFEGFGFNFYNGINDYVMLGGRFGWNNFFEKIDRHSVNYHDGAVAGTVTGTQYRRASTMQFLFEGTFVGRNSSILLPYLSVGMGPSWDRKENLIGIWNVTKETVHFAIRPELGLIVPFDKVGVKLSGAYNGIFNNSDSGTDDMDHFTIGLGIAFGNFN